MPMVICCHSSIYCEATLDNSVTMDVPPDADEQLRLALAEVRDLQRTVVFLRTELEAAHLERQQQLQDAASAAHNETAQLRDTIVALRERLERDTQAHADAMQQAAASHRNEVIQLHDAIRALRSTLEARA